jgi:hypothetical protein
VGLRRQAVAAEIRDTAAASFVLLRNDEQVLPLAGPQLRRAAEVPAPACRMGRE